MKNKKAMRIISVIANALLLCAGSVILLIFMRHEKDVPQEISLGVGIFSFITFLLLVLIFIIEFVSALRIESSTFHTALIALFLLTGVAFCPDIIPFYELIGLPRVLPAEKIASEVCFIAVEISIFSFFCYTYCTEGKKLPLYPLFAAAAIALAVYVSLFSSQAKIIAHFFFLFVIIVYFGILQVRSYLANVDNVTFAFTAAIFFSCAGMHTANALYYSDLVPYSGGLSSAYIWVCIVCFISIYLNFFIQIDQAARRAKDYQSQNERLKMKVLAGQIKPHFIFNALTTIKSGYHGDVSAGDNALGLFSEYMRESLSLLDTDIISFEQELKNISHYIDFINTGQVHPFNILYNIDATDFSVPAFSLQPFIENAVKYSKVNEKENGYIMISTAGDDTFTEIRITDNGVGFDTSQIRTGAHGINNAKERFRLLFNTEPVIRSIASVGTEITITLRHTAEEAKVEDPGR